MCMLQVFVTLAVGLHLFAFLFVILLFKKYNSHDVEEACLAGLHH